MPCNLAVSITKAAVTEERLLALLTPEAVQPVVEAYLRQPGVLKAWERASVSRAGGTLRVTIGSLTLTISGGQVQSNAAGLCDLLDALERALRTADRRLTRLGPAVTAAEGLYHACDWLAHITSDAEADAACAEIDAAAAAVCEAVGALRMGGQC